MRARRVGVLALISLGTLAVLAGCSSGGIQVNDKPVKAPEVFLSKVESKWRGTATEGRANLHKDAHCFYAAPEGSKNVEWTVFCGPIKHYVDPDNASSSESDKRDGIWDSYEYEPQATADGYVLDEYDSTAKGINLPSGLVLSRPDGKQPPADGDKLAAPPPPPAKAGYLNTDAANVTIKSPKKPADGRVVTPKTAITVTAVGSADRVKTDEGTRSAPKGEKFIVAKLSLAAGPSAKAYDSWSSGKDLINADVAYALQLGSDRKPIEWESVYGSDTKEKTFVAAVPANSDPQLLVSAAGKDQTLSLTTGERTSKVADVYYRSKSEAGISRQYASQHYEKEDFNTDFSLLFERATLTPFDPKRGWAPDGKAWLRLETDQVSNEFEYFDFEMVLQHAKTTTVKDDKGQTSADLTKSEEIGTPGDTVVEPIFEVDATATKFTVNFKPSLTFTAEDEYSKPHSGQFTLAPMTFDVEFGQS